MNKKVDSKITKLLKLFIVLFTNVVFFIHILPKLQGEPILEFDRYSFTTFLFLPSIFLYFWINEPNKKEKLIYVIGIWPGILIIPLTFGLLLLISLSGL